MGQQILLRNSIDTWVSPSRPVSRFGDTRLYIHSTSNALIYFARPRLPDGSMVLSARLRIKPGESTGTASTTVNLHRLTGSFDPGTVTWASQPGVVASAAASITRPWYSAGAVMEFDVTAELQAIVDGAAWFGWRISSPSTDTTQYLHGGQSLFPLELVIEYSAPPQAPIDLIPNSNNKVTDPKPTLSWTTPGGPMSTQLAFQIQVATNSAFTTGLYTSNEIASGASSVDLDTIAPAFTALTSGQSRWWRVRVKNDYGTWSPYSLGAQFTYTTPFIVNVTTPPAVTSDPTPTLTWTYSGSMIAWQVLVYESRVTEVQPEKLVYDSGIQHSVVTSMDIPEGVVSFANSVTYTAFVRVWDTGALVSIAGAPTYAEDSIAWVWDPTGATPPVELEVTPWLEQRPGRLVRWRYTGAAASRFLVYRNEGAKDFYYYVDAASAREGVTDWYRFLDWPSGRKTNTWAVLTIMPDGSMSTWAESPQEVLHVDYRMPFVMSTSDTAGRHFCLVNATIDPGLTEISDVVVPVAGAPYLAQYALQKFNGHAEGLISNDALPGILTAEQMKDNFLWFRANPSMRFFFQDQAPHAYIYNSAFRPVGRPDGKTDYFVSFDFVEV